MEVICLQDEAFYVLVELEGLLRAKNNLSWKIPSNSLMNEMIINDLSDD